MKDPKVPPKVGDTIFVGAHYYIDHGEDDVDGGLGVVSNVRREGRYIFVSVDQHPGTSYNWEFLAENQEEYFDRFGDEVAKPNPDI